MRLEISADIGLDEPSVDGGFITWFNVVLHDIVDEAEAETREPAGTARVARVHVGEAANAGADLLDCLDADSGELEAIYHLYFDKGQFRVDFAEGAGCDLLYVGEIVIEPAWRDRNLELAVVHRLCTALGEGCEIVVVPCGSPDEARHWRQLGFEITTRGEREGFMHLKRAYKRPRVVDPDGTCRFKVLPDLTPEQRRTHH